MRMFVFVMFVSAVLCQFAAGQTAVNNNTESTDSPDAGSGAASTNPPGGIAPARHSSPVLVTKNSVKSIPASRRANQSFYWRNRLELSLETGWLPINIPFPLDPLLGDAYHTYPLKYTLVPVFASLRWQLTDVSGHGIFRGNWDATATLSGTAIPRGPESRYFAYIMGIRRNFVRSNQFAAPYFDVQLGMGNVDAKGPTGIRYAQGQDFTFTANAGSGVRFNFRSGRALAIGMHWMHMSNANLAGSSHNYGINVLGPVIGFYMPLPGHHQQSSRFVTAP